MKNLPLNYFISGLTKEEIRDNAHMLGEKFPASWNKERMSLALAAVYERDPSVFLRMLSESTIAFTYMVFKEKMNARFLLSKEIADEQYENIMENLGELEYLGLAAYELNRFVIADIMKKALSGYPDKHREQLKRWQQMEYCAFGILVAYGIVEMREYVRMFRECYPEFSEEDALLFLNRRIGLRLHSSRLMVDKKEEWVYCDIMDEPDGWYELIQRKQDIPYRMYTKDEYISIFNEGYPREPAKYMELVDILTRQGLSEEAAKDSLLKSALLLCKQLQITSGIPEIVREIEWQSEKDLKAFINSYFRFTNDLPIWANKGYSPNEMIARFQNTTKPAIQPRGKILQFSGTVKHGRNDPCPCGSGEKYKNCCGKLQ
jgi:hypothetical protein